MPERSHALPASWRELLPSEADVEFYREHGWYITGRIFSDDEIADALRGVDRHYRGELDRDLRLDIKQYLNWTADREREQPLRLNDYIVLQNAQVGALARGPVLGAIASRLTGSPEIRLFNSSLIYKPPGVESDKVRIGWHADRAYWQTCTSDIMLTAWIPLQDCDASMGTVTMIDGSHRWPETDTVRRLRRDRTFICDDLEALESRVEGAGVPVRRVPMEMRRGQVSFHHCMTLHGSGPNRSDGPRIAVAVHLQDRDNRYRRHIVDGEPYVYNNDRLVRRLPNGDPDYSDPSICPTLWSDGDG